MYQGVTSRTGMRHVANEWVVSHTCKELQVSVSHHPATQCSTMQHTATLAAWVGKGLEVRVSVTLQRTATHSTHCNTLQHTATLAAWGGKGSYTCKELHCSLLCDLTRFCESRDSSTCVTWLICVCDMTSAQLRALLGKIASLGRVHPPL